MQPITPSFLSSSPRKTIRLRATLSSRGFWLECLILLTALVACLGPAAGVVRRIHLHYGAAAATAAPTFDDRHAQLDATLSGASPVPFSASPARLHLASLDPAAVDAVLGRLHPTRNIGLSLLLHSAAIYGLDMQVPDYPGVRRPTLKELLFNSDLATSYFPGSHLLARTAWGLRNPTQRLDRKEWQSALPAHPGQLLCELAKHGVSLDERLTVDERAFHIKDLLRDAMATFNLNDPELEWTSIALILYLPPQKTWIDKFGNQHSFDELAEELSHREVDPRQHPCHGIHLLEALTILLKADETHHLLSSTCKDRLRNYLADQTAYLVRTQCDDGSWSESWSRWVPSSSSDASRPRRGSSNKHDQVLVTGHHVQWLLLLPRDMLPPDQVFERAAGFLVKALLAAKDEDLVNNYCPYSHAAHSLLLLTAGERR